MMNKKTLRLLAHILAPVIFALIGYLSFYIAFRPLVETARSVISIFSAGWPVEYKAEARMIYDPDAESPEIQEEEEEPYILIQDIQYPNLGDCYGRISNEKTGLDCPVYMGDSYDIIRSGAGQYSGSGLPGFGRMILLCAHNISHFRPLFDMEVGDIIQFDTNYCDYTYEVIDVEVYNERVLEDWIVEHLFDEEELLVMYTCYPLQAQVTRKTDRLTVICKRTSGIDVKWRFGDDQ